MNPLDAIIFLHPTLVNGEDYVVIFKRGAYFVAWFVGSPAEPTAQQISDVYADVTPHPVTGDVYSVWVTKNSPDQRSAKDDVVDGPGPFPLAYRALYRELTQSLRKTERRVIQLQNVVAAMLESTGGTANLRADGIAAAAVAFPQTQTADSSTHFPNTDETQNVQVRNDIRVRIDAGDND